MKERFSRGNGAVNCCPSSLDLAPASKNGRHDHHAARSHWKGLIFFSGPQTAHAGQAHQTCGKKYGTRRDGNG